MTTHKKLTAASPWVELATSNKDWDAATPSLLATMLAQTILIRSFEEYVLELAGRD